MQGQVERSQDIRLHGRVIHRFLRYGCYGVVFFSHASSYHDINTAGSTIRHRRARATVFHKFHGDFVTYFAEYFALFRGFFNGPLHDVKEVGVFRPVYSFTRRQHGASRHDSSPRDRLVRHRANSNSHGHQGPRRQGRHGRMQRQRVTVPADQRLTGHGPCGTGGRHGPGHSGRSNGSPCTGHSLQASVHGLKASGYDRPT